MNRTKLPAARASLPQGLLLPEQRILLWTIATISIFTNVLMLTGPLFMLQVYDRVLSSQSEATLIVLLSLVAFLYAMMGLLDHARARIAARLGAQLHQRLDLRVFEAALDTRRGRKGDLADAARTPQDLTFLQQMSGSPVFMALFDLPWAPLFILVIALLHPLLGLTALCFAALLAMIGLASHRRNHRLTGEYLQALQQADSQARKIASQAPLLQTLGIKPNALSQWRRQRETALQNSLAAQDYTGRFTATVRSLRLFMQSALLAVGAALVLVGDITPGAMIAATIILGRALAPLDQLIGGWQQVVAARGAIQRVREGLNATAPALSAPLLPGIPQGEIRVERLYGPAPSAGARSGAVLNNISFTIKPGQALGVIGPSASGKTALAAALTGSLRPAAGDIRLDNVPLAKIPPDQLGRFIGYLPQGARLFEGSLRDNIARFDPDAEDEAVIHAAQTAGAHDMIQSLPDGYATQIHADGSGLSGGQTQQVALARCLFGAPSVLILDAPETQLDELGQKALQRAIRAAKSRGTSVIIMAHRPAAITDCDLLLKLDKGRMITIGPPEAVLRDVTHNSAAVLRHRAQPTLSRMTQMYPWEMRSSESRP